MALTTPPNFSSLLYQADKPRTLPLRVITPRNFDPGSPVVRRLSGAHRIEHYFLLFVKEGELSYSVDLHPATARSDAALFVLPHQIRTPPATKARAEFVKLTFDQSVLARLPRSYRFWLDPFSTQTVPLDGATRPRVWSVLSLLEETWANGAGDTDLVLAYLQALMGELEAAYFARGRHAGDNRDLETLVRFKTLVEETFARQPKVVDLARTLGQSETRLYTMVKALTGLSPKAFLTKRTILEAQRLLYYSRPSVKELAAHLGVDDESYFSRLFKRQVGCSVSAFVANLEEKSTIDDDSSLPVTSGLE
jgi:AraC-like DNA-binding protein